MIRHCTFVCLMRNWISIDVLCCAAHTETAALDSLAHHNATAFNCTTVCIRRGVHGRRWSVPCRLLDHATRHPALPS
jgi:hypothetical protein